MREVSPRGAQTHAQNTRPRVALAQMKRQEKLRQSTTP